MVKLSLIISKLLMYSTIFFINIGEQKCQNEDVTNTFNKYLHEKANTNLIF